jgi:phosphatidylethanolamine-binding protein (PEBP) family uncharacterized protein
MPPPGASHRYVFTLHALDTVLDLSPGVTRDEVESAMKRHVLETTSLTGVFAR